MNSPHWAPSPLLLSLSQPFTTSNLLQIVTPFRRRDTTKAWFPLKNSFFPIGYQFILQLQRSLVGNIVFFYRIISLRIILSKKLRAKTMNWRNNRTTCMHHIMKLLFKLYQYFWGSIYNFAFHKGGSFIKVV